MLKVGLKIFFGEGATACLVAENDTNIENETTLLMNGISGEGEVYKYKGGDSSIDEEKKIQQAYDLLRGIDTKQDIRKRYFIRNVVLMIHQFSSLASSLFLTLEILQTGSTFLCEGDFTTQESYYICSQRYDRSTMIITLVFSTGVCVQIGMIMWSMMKTNNTKKKFLRFCSGFWIVLGGITIVAAVILLIFLCYRHNVHNGLSVEASDLNQFLIIQSFLIFAPLIVPTFGFAIHCMYKDDTTEENAIYFALNLWNSAEPLIAKDFNKAIQLMFSKECKNE